MNEQNKLAVLVVCVCCVWAAVVAGCGSAETEDYRSDVGEPVTIRNIPGQLEEKASGPQQYYRSCYTEDLHLVVYLRTDYGQMWNDVLVDWSNNWRWYMETMGWTFVQTTYVYTDQPRQHPPSLADRTISVGYGPLGGDPLAETFYVGDFWGQCHRWSSIIIDDAKIWDVFDEYVDHLCPYYEDREYNQLYNTLSHEGGHATGLVHCCGLLMQPLTPEENGCFHQEQGQAYSNVNETILESYAE